MTEVEHCFNEIEEVLHYMFRENSNKRPTIYEKMRLLRYQQDITKKNQYRSDRNDHNLANDLLSLLEEFLVALIQL